VFQRALLFLSADDPVAKPTANGTNSITITPPMGNLFFRLSNP
jgi:hypothetical protein